MKAIKSVAESKGMDRVVRDLKSVARYRTIHLCMFAAMLGAFMFDFTRNVILK